MTSAVSAAAQAVEYVPGKQAVAGARAVRIAANENPMPPLPSVLAAMQDGLGQVNRYPEPRADSLRAALAERLGSTADMITVGPGAGPLTERAIIAACRPGRDLVFAQLTFIAYQNHAAMAGANAVRIPLDADLTHDLDAMLAAIGPQTGAVIVCNPNNPTGTGVAPDRLAAFVAAVPSSCTVILDEAYVDFADGAGAPSLSLVSDYSNLLIVRTFSKAHGLAGLRVGYAIAQPESIAGFNQARNIFQINAIGDLAARASLAARVEFDERVEFIRTERAWLTEQLTKLGHEVTPSQANFVWLPMPAEDGAAFTAYLESQAILVRHLGPGVRITIGTHDENEQLLAALQARS